ncbi:helix-turn-helix domain-containing protein [Alloyangia pacifica]|uniref:helix-turn-helix domain-containing protein n=1 Tax=Alloyangia pacifica TaxID=311180 RepID=UPI001CFD56BD|nr:helix-turn-helix domain-containing protein [Alloyangia pacifica]
MKVDREEFRRLHAQGWSDRNLRDHFKVRHSTVMRVREALGLARNPYSVPSGPQAFSESELRDMHEAGLCDAEIAEKLGVSAASVLRWRRRLIGLPSNPVPEERQRIAEERARTSIASGPVGAAVRGAFSLSLSDPRIMTMLEPHSAEAMRAAA